VNAFGWWLSRDKFTNRNCWNVDDAMNFNACSSIGNAIRK
jgi:hypothetical protein